MSLVSSLIVRSALLTAMILSIAPLIAFPAAADQSLIERSAQQLEIEVQGLGNPDSQFVVSGLEPFTGGGLQAALASNALGDQDGSVIFQRSSGCSMGCSNGCSTGCSVGCSTGCSVGCSTGCR